MNYEMPKNVLTSGSYSLKRRSRQLVVVLLSSCSLRLRDEALNGPLFLLNFIPPLGNRCA